MLSRAGERRLNWKSRIGCSSIISNKGQLRFGHDDDDDVNNGGDGGDDDDHDHDDDDDGDDDQSGIKYRVCLQFAIFIGS